MGDKNGEYRNKRGKSGRERREEAGNDKEESDTREKLWNSRMRG